VSDVFTSVSTFASEYRSLAVNASEYRSLAVNASGQVSSSTNKVDGLVLTSVRFVKKEAGGQKSIDVIKFY